MLASLYTHHHGSREVNNDHQNIFNQECQTDEQGYHTHSYGEVAGIRGTGGGVVQAQRTQKDLVRNTAKHYNGEKLERNMYLSVFTKNLR